MEEYTREMVQACIVCLHSCSCLTLLTPLVSRAGGGILVDGVEVRVPQAIMEEAQAELAGRTGLTDSEPEDGDMEV